MIVLSATRLDAGGRFRFEVEEDGSSAIVSEDADVIALALGKLRVANPRRLLDHACTWGQVEIQSGGSVVLRRVDRA